MINFIVSRRAKIFLFSSCLTLAAGLFCRHILLRRKRNSIHFTYSKRVLHKLFIILRILFPNVLSKTSLWISIHLSALLLRTALTIYIINLKGGIVRCLIQRNIPGFMCKIRDFLTIGIPLGFIKGLIRFIESKLTLVFRSRLLHHAYDLYFYNQTYYRISHLDSRLLTSDQDIPYNIEILTSKLINLFSRVTKSVFDITILSWLIATMIRKKSPQRSLIDRRVPVLTSIVFIIIYWTLRKLSSGIDKMKLEETTRQCLFHQEHRKIMFNAEQIAISNGDRLEKSSVLKAYGQLQRQTDLIIKKQWWLIMFEQICMKSVWYSCEMMFIAMSVLKHEERMETDVLPIDGSLEIPLLAERFIISESLFSFRADALQRIVSSYKEIDELSRCINQVCRMLHIFDECAHEQYLHKSISKSRNCLVLKRKINGKLIESGEDITMTNVSITTPNGNVLVENLTLTIKPTMHVLICGPKGSGKSSFFRVLQGLWPVYSGHLCRPSSSDLLFITKQPYMCSGTLRDQIIYPQMVDQIHIHDDQIIDSLERVGLKHIVEREGGLTAEHEWKDLLSESEQQLLVLARIFYHKPKYALLDECTSAITLDIESKIFEQAKQLGISLLVVTNRAALWTRHASILKFHGDGHWTFELFNEQKNC